jgi:hypothetical protein
MGVLLDQYTKLCKDYITPVKIGVKNLKVSLFTYFMYLDVFPTWLKLNMSLDFYHQHGLYLYYIYKDYLRIRDELIHKATWFDEYAGSSNNYFDYG